MLCYDRRAYNRFSFLIEGLFVKQKKTTLNEHYGFVCYKIYDYY